MIQLNADESMLLLITKNHLHKDVPLENMLAGSIEYIKACCKQRVWGNYKTDKEVDVFGTYLNLVPKLCTRFYMMNVLEEIWKHISGWYILPQQRHEITVLDLEQYLISAFRNRPVNDLVMDEELIKSIEGE